MDDVEPRIRKQTRKKSSMFVDHEKLDTTSTPTNEVGLYEALMEVGPSKDWGMIPPKENKRICNKYDTCVVYLHEKYNDIFVRNHKWNDTCLAFDKRLIHNVFPET